MLTSPLLDAEAKSRRVFAHTPALTPNPPNSTAQTTHQLPEVSDSRSGTVARLLALYSKRARPFSAVDAAAAVVLADLDQRRADKATRASDGCKDLFRVSRSACHAPRGGLKGPGRSSG
jgi:hypothetical protein